ncbi:MAG: phosphoenolpyruvate--protein phosphotransferase [Candidatus Omnitrophica bacterium]|nr:phosphoenolpyruvate--protein phosphotransferase [Candidatus Omnitrophota bacterium]
MGQIELRGIPAAPGITIGKVHLLDSEELVVKKKRIPQSQLKKEAVRFEDALNKTRREIVEIKDKISVEMGREHGEIFSAHLLVLEDKVLIEEVKARLKKEKVVVEYIFLDVLKKYINAFSKIDDEYLKDRISDINDVGKRILRNLIGATHKILSDVGGEKVVVVAYDLSPSDTASMYKKDVIGIATDIGGRTSHTAIMAKSLEIPAVVGLETITKRANNGDMIVVDGNHGVIIINPTKQTLLKYKSDQKRFRRFDEGLVYLKDLPCQTLDGRRVELVANIELPEEVPSVLFHGAEGIGLYRTEFFYMNRRDLPTEEEHFQGYKKVAQDMAPRHTIVRTLDLGGDKFLSELEVPREMNPFLGWRAIRFCLARPDIFKTQLKAILRASAFGKLKIMYPMISGLNELRQANVILEEVKKELRASKISFDEDIAVGAMIEVPSAALTSDILAKEVDFFSIGTNDLIQYSLAVDRVNEKIAYLYEPAHPAVLRLVKTIIDNGHKEGIWVGMCGEMAGDPNLTLILLGLGLDEFSTPSIMLPEIKHIVRSVKMADAKLIAQEALMLPTGREVEAYARKKLLELVSETREGV